MKILKTASGNKIKLSKKEWESIGKKAGWDIDRNDHKLRRRTVKVTLDDGDVITTEINGTKESVEYYYYNNQFVANDETTMRSVANVEFLD